MPGREGTAQEEKAARPEGAQRRRLSNVFTPGLVHYMCSHGVLIDFEVLESAESPACIAEALARRLSLAPEAIYFVTAFQAARNAARRMPWLLRQSTTRYFLDRFHQSPHVLSDIYKAVQYPTICSMHQTYVVESRHALNKPLRHQVSYMDEDRFISHMRQYGALSNLRIMQRYSTQTASPRRSPRSGIDLFPSSFISM